MPASSASHLTPCTFPPNLNPSGLAHAQQSQGLVAASLGLGKLAFPTVPTQTLLLPHQLRTSASRPEAPPVLSLLQCSAPVRHSVGVRQVLSGGRFHDGKRKGRGPLRWERGFSEGEKRGEHVGSGPASAHLSGLILRGRSYAHREGRDPPPCRTGCPLGAAAALALPSLSISLLPCLPPSPLPSSLPSLQVPALPWARLEPVRPSPTCLLRGGPSSVTNELTVAQPPSEACCCDSLAQWAVQWAV